MSEPKITTVIYESGSYPTETSWDVIHVVGKYENGLTAKHYILARDPAGTIRLRTDVFLERWEVITDTEELRIAEKHFTDRDRLSAEEAAKAAIA